MDEALSSEESVGGLIYWETPGGKSLGRSALYPDAMDGNTWMSTILRDGSGRIDRMPGSVQCMFGALLLSATGILLLLFSALAGSFSNAYLFNENSAALILVALLGSIQILTNFSKRSINRFGKSACHLRIMNSFMIISIHIVYDCLDWVSAVIFPYVHVEIGAIKLT